MLLSSENITNIIPQKEPFVMIDNLLSASDKDFISTFKVKESNIFFYKGKLQEAALIENIAQTVAAGFGYIDNLNSGVAKLGFIGSIAKLKLYRLPDLNEELTTKVTQLYKFENIYLVKGESFVQGKIILECEMKIVVEE